VRIAAIGEAWRRNGLGRERKGEKDGGCREKTGWVWGENFIKNKIIIKH